MKIINSLCILLIAALMLACEIKTSKLEPEQTKSNENINFSEQQVKIAGIKTGTFYDEIIHHHIECTGSVTLLPQNKATVSVPVNGFVQNINATIGEWVERGFVAITLSHSDYIDMQTNYLTTSSEFEFAQKEFERQQILREEDAISEKAYQKTKAEFEVLWARKAGLAAKLKMIGIIPENVNGENIVNTIQVKVPISGYVDEINVSLGEMVTPEKYMLKIINNRESCITLDVFAQYKNLLEVGQQIEYSISGTGDNIFNAVIISIGQSIDAHKKTLQVLAQPINYNTSFAQGTFVDALIFTPGKVTKVLPEAAVVTKNGKSFIYIEKAQGEYHKLHINVTQIHDGHVAIREVDSLKTAKIVLEGVNYLVAEEG